MIATSLLRDALARSGLLVGSTPTLPQQVVGVVDDSRQVTPGSAFIAVRGSVHDGHSWLADAARRGIALAVVEDAGATGLPALVVSDSRLAAAALAAAVHDHPADALSIVGVTGTSGKTTTVFMLRHLLDAHDSPTASIGTLGVVRPGAPPADPDSGLTTPGPFELQRTLRELADSGVKRVAMEVSSHSLDQNRVDGIAFDAAVFTNLSRDHLDYHKDAEAYFAAKARLVTLLAPEGALILNADAPEWRALPTGPRRILYGLSDDAEVSAGDARYGPRGSEWLLRIRHARSVGVRLPLIGDFNVCNALGAAAAAWSLGVEPPDIADRLSNLPQIPGRLELISVEPPVLRDYAHKPDALDRALRAVRPFTRGRLIVVFGCGGDRDRGKRPIMGNIAESLAEVVIITSDNPRTEDPERILDDIEAGMKKGLHRRIADRRSAIKAAFEAASHGDIVLLAGKGHETYQIHGTSKAPFDEKVIVEELTGRTQ
ncbi:MAG: UDP-N-acetylmuramoyl-L-alanyl-D-glutamate--2,6-diaminopimelate ligase [Gemmatimonadota bacterium]